MGEEEDSRLGDFIEDAEALVPVDAASFILLQEQLESVLHTLSERENKVIQLRFGLLDGHPHTLAEVGREVQGQLGADPPDRVEDPLEAPASLTVAEAPRLPGVDQDSYKSSRASIDACHAPPGVRRSGLGVRLAKCTPTLSNSTSACLQSAKLTTCETGIDPKGYRRRP